MKTVWVEIKKGALIQNKDTRRWVKTKEIIAVPVMGMHYGIYIVKIGENYYSVDYTDCSKSY